MAGEPRLDSRYGYVCTQTHTCAPTHVFMLKDIAYASSYCPLSSVAV